MSFPLSYQRVDGKIQLDWIPPCIDDDEAAIRIIDSQVQVKGEFSLARVSASIIEVRHQDIYGTRYSVIETIQISKRTRYTAIQFAVNKFISSWCPDMDLLELDETSMVPWSGFSLGSSRSAKDSKAVTVNERRVIKNLWSKFKAIKGKIQSGKTKFTLSVAIRLRSENISTLIILRNNNSDLVQIRDRLKGMLEVVRDFLRANHFEVGDYQIEVMEKDLSEDEFREFSTGSKPKILLAICHGGNLTKLAKWLPAEGDHDFNYAVIIDEIDLLDNPLSEAGTQLALLKKHAYCTFGVSATILDALLSEDVSKEDLIQLSVLSCYNDFPKLKHVAISTPFRFSTSTNDNLLETDSGLGEFLEMISNCEAEYDSYHSGFIPRLALIAVGETVEPLKDLFDHTRISYPDMVSILILSDSYKSKKNPNKNCKGIQLHAPGIEEIITLEDGVESKYIDGYHTFVGTGIKAVLLWLRNNGGVEAFPNGVIISHNMVQRCTSVVSGDCGDLENLHWHLTDERVGAAKSTDCPELLQKLRILGNFADSVTVRIWATMECYDAIRRAYHIQDELINRSLKLEGDASLGDKLQTIPINKAKPPKGRSLTKNAEYHLNTVLEKDGGLYMGAYDGTPFNYKLKSKKSSSPSATIVRPVGEWGVKDLVANLQRAVRSGTKTKIVQILQYFLGGEIKHTQVTKAILAEECNLKLKAMGDYTSWKKEGTRYAILVESHHGVSLCPKILSALEINKSIGDGKEEQTTLLQQILAM